MKDSLFSLDGQVAIVTGALGLIGKEHCRALAEYGATVVVADLDEINARHFAQTLPKALGLALDITQKASVERARDQILTAFGRIDVLVNNAAVNDMFENPQQAGELSKLENYPLELWQKSMDANVTGTFLCAQVFGTVMAAQRRGSIINVASTYGIVAPDQSIYRKPSGEQSFYKSPSYPTTKGAVLSLTRFLATYWGGAGVRVNSLSPGGVENNQDAYFLENYSRRTPLGRMAAPTDYRGAVVFLASGASSYMTGANLVVDGGWTAW